jgi:creatinine amidohydrolase
VQQPSPCCPSGATSSTARTPLATDTLVAGTLAREIAAAYPVRLLPPVAISCSQEHAAWPGTVSISAATLAAVVRDIAASVHRAGVDSLVLVNAHGGNYVLGHVVQETCPPRMALFPHELDWVDARVAAGCETSILTDMHAGELETSILLHAYPHLVRPPFRDELADDRRHLLSRGMRSTRSREWWAVRRWRRRRRDERCWRAWSALSPRTSDQ